MKKELKPVCTRYKNQVFRSRLEARWAVFLDELGFEWEYEPEGYDVDGEWYLPDFYVYGLEIYAEVKHKGGDFSKAKKFPEATGKDIWLCEGVPEARVYEIHRAEGGMILATPEWDQAQGEGRFFWEPAYEEADGTYSEEYQDCFPKYMQAVEAALNYDFKF